MSKLLKDLKINVHSYKFWLAALSVITIAIEFIAQNCFHVSISSALNGTISNLINTILILLVGLGVIDNKPIDEKPVDIESTWEKINQEINELKDVVSKASGEQTQVKKEQEQPKVITPTITYYPKNK